MAKWWKPFTSAGDVGTSVVAKYGDDIVRMAGPSVVSKAGGETAYLAKVTTDINKGVMKQLDNFANKLSGATPGKLTKIRNQLAENAQTYTASISKSAGLPADVAGDLQKALNSKMGGMFIDATKKSNKGLIGKVDDVAGATGKTADEIAEANATLGSRILNGTWGTAKRNKGKIVLAGIGYVVWSGGLDLVGGAAKFLERHGFIPEGSTGALAAFWSNLRGFITFILWGGIILGTFWIMNMVFGVAKTAKGVVDTVTDNIVPDGEPSGA